MDDKDKNKKKGYRISKRLSAWDATCHILTHKNDEKIEFKKLWTGNELDEQIKSVENLNKSLSVLKKHLPKKYHPLVKLAITDKVWILSVEKSVTATRLQMMLDEISMRIAKQIGFAPRIRISTKPKNWVYAGLSLHTKKVEKITTPSIDEAKQIIDEFLSSKI